MITLFTKTIENYIIVVAATQAYLNQRNRNFDFQVLYYLQVLNSVRATIIMTNNFR
jgi:hypothetical protein